MFSLIMQVIARSGVWGVFLLMLVENLVLVIPSELILPLAGFQAARGLIDPVWSVVAATAGSALGGAAWYGLGHGYGLDRLQGLVRRHGRWFPVSQDEIRHAIGWFERWGALALVFGRALPGVRAVICIPAGVARMAFLRFMLWSTLGAALWSALLVGAGYVLSAHYDVVGRWINPLSDGFFALCAALYLARVIRYRPADQ